MTSASQSQPSQTWLTLGRYVWIAITVLTLALLTIGIPERIQRIASSADWRSIRQLGLSVSSFATLAVVIDSIFLLGHFSLAGVIFWRRRNDRMALLVALTMVTNGSLMPLLLTYEGVALPPLWDFMKNVVVYTSMITCVTLLFVFPDGRFIPRGAALLALGWAALCLPAIFLPASPFSLTQWPRVVQILLLIVVSGSGVYAQFYRYNRVSRALERQQAKWALLGLTATALSPFAYFLTFVIFTTTTQQHVPNLLYQRLGASFFSSTYLLRLFDSVGFNLFTLLFPISFAIAIMRYRLWDIDLLINRALVYGALSATLLISYLAIVIFLEVVLRALTGEGQNDLVTVISTLSIAALFAPFRRRVQRGIDRRFYRRKYNAARTVEAFSAGLRQEVELNSLCERLINVVQETVQPEQVSLWLKPEKSRGRMDLHTFEDQSGS